MHVLVVDDDPMVQKLLQRGLASEGHVVDVAANAQQGLHLAQAGVFDVLVLDVSLPGMTGLEVSAALRAREQRAHPDAHRTGRAER